MASAYCLAAAITGEDLAAGRRPFITYSAAGTAPAAEANNVIHQRPVAATTKAGARMVREAATHMGSTLSRHRLTPKERKVRKDQARIIHGCRSEAVETEGRRGFSQARATQAYSQRYVEETEREKPRRTRGSAAAVG